MTLKNKLPDNVADQRQNLFLLHQKLDGLEENLKETVLEEVEKTLATERFLLQESLLATVEELAGNIAHQWRQPLNIIGLSVQKLQFDFERNEVDGKYVEDLSREVLDILRQMSRTVKDFRNFMQADASRQQFSLNETIRQVLSFVDGSLKSAGIVVVLHTPDEDILVDNYRNELIRIVLGIINKSKKVLQQSKPDAPRIELRISRGNKRGIITISDNGGTIPSEELERIFDPDHNDGTRGTGMELHMASMVIGQKMNGKLKVFNRGDGVEFRIEL